MKWKHWKKKNCVWNRTNSIYFLSIDYLSITPYRRLGDEDDELSEVQPDAVPPEVREWLASTFTRQMATTRPRTDEKPKFRSVAHAIRAGIFVDRIYRRVSSSTLMQFPPDVVKLLKVSKERRWNKEDSTVDGNVRFGRLSDDNRIDIDW